VAVDVPLSANRWMIAKTIGKALLRLAGLLALVSLATFVLLSYSPIDPIKAYIGNDLLHVPPAQYAKIAARWGLDQPLWLRYWHWFGRVLQGDLGYSMLYNAPVSEVIGQRFAASFALLAGAWLLSGSLGVLLGLCAGRYLNRWPDRLICRLAYLLASLPTFWVGLLLLAIFAVHWPLLPVCCAWTPGLDAGEVDWAMRARHLVLPVATLALLGMGNIALHTRGRVAEVLASDFIRYARAQGDGGWPMLRFHVLRHALTPALCLQFASLGELIGGSLLAEKVFAYPGLGQATVDAGLRGDIPLLMGIVLFCTLLVFVGNSMASVLLARINQGWEGRHAV
jgi:peptide/nickel transport system permease protein